MDEMKKLKHLIDENNAVPIPFSRGYYLTENDRILKPNGKFSTRQQARSKKNEGQRVSQYQDLSGNYKSVLLSSIRKEVDNFRENGQKEFIHQESLDRHIEIMNS